MAPAAAALGCHGGSAFVHKRYIFSQFRLCLPMSLKMCIFCACPKKATLGPRLPAAWPRLPPRLAPFWSRDGIGVVTPPRSFLVQAPVSRAQHIRAFVPDFSRGGTLNIPFVEALYLWITSSQSSLRTNSSSRPSSTYEAGDIKRTRTCDLRNHHS